MHTVIKIERETEKEETANIETTTVIHGTTEITNPATIVNLRSTDKNIMMISTTISKITDIVTETIVHRTTIQAVTIRMEPIRVMIIITITQVTVVIPEMTAHLDIMEIIIIMAESIIKRKEVIIGIMIITMGVAETTETTGIIEIRNMIDFHNLA